MIAKKSCDVVVMGGGVMGSSIAYHLSSMGCRNVTVIEKDPGYKHASAMLSVGILWNLISTIFYECLIFCFRLGVSDSNFLLERIFLCPSMALSF